MSEPTEGIKDKTIGQNSDQTSDQTSDENSDQNRNVNIMTQNNG